MGVTAPGQMMKADISVFPVPAMDELTFMITTPVQTRATIELLNEQGAGHKTIYNGNLSRGNNSIQTDISMIPPGIYLCRILTNEGITSKKILIIK